MRSLELSWKRKGFHSNSDDIQVTPFLTILLNASLILLNACSLYPRLVHTYL